MTSFESQFFQKVKFTPEQIKSYFTSAERDYAIAMEDKIPEVKFKFVYDAFIKIGIAVIAREGYKVRSQPGHHVKIIAKLSEIFGDENVDILGNVMRQRRNKDFYDGANGESSQIFSIVKHQIVFVFGRKDDHCNASVIFVNGLGA